MKNLLKSLWKALLQIEHFVVIACCAAMVLLVFDNVLMRYIFKTSFQGMEDLIMLFAFGIYFIGAALSSREETQITADVMSLFIKKPRSLVADFPQLPAALSAALQGQQLQPMLCGART